MLKLEFILPLLVTDGYVDCLLLSIKKHPLKNMPEASGIPSEHVSFAANCKICFKESQLLHSFGRENPSKYVIGMYSILLCLIWTCVMFPR